MIRLAITTGDPAGIGPEIAVKALQFYPLREELCYIVYGSLPDYEDGTQAIRIDRIEDAIEPGALYHIPIVDESILPGQPSQASGKNSHDILSRCRDDLKNGQLQGVVTCPISKHEIRKTDPGFIGHTEFFAEDPEQVVMSFWGDHFNVALLTTHVSLCEVGHKLNLETIVDKLRIIYLNTTKLIDHPQFAMLGVNPHAGESGAFGTEEAMLEEAIAILKKDGIAIDGPFPADTFFSTKATQYDMIVSAYHDQALIPFKMVHANRGVNMTLGLPFVRTSVDHGTAFDIAGQDSAREGSLEYAIRLAERALIEKDVVFVPIYDAFAPFYDQYMAHVKYNEWVKLILSQYNKLRKRSPKKVIELACGTANIACRLVRRGIEVDACDLAVSMVKNASRKQFKPNLFRHDMLDPLKRSGYDLAIMMFDSLNYLSSESEIGITLEHIHNALIPQGILIFDITTIRNCRDNFDGFVNIEDNGTCYMVHTSELDAKEENQITSLTFFQNRGFFYQRNDEVHRQCIFPTSVVLDRIGKSPFNLLGIYSIDKPGNLMQSPSQKLDESYDRLFFVLEKP